MENVLMKLTNASQNEVGINQFIAKTILDNLHTIPKMQIKNMASLSYTSPTTITRFSQKLNYGGWVELKLDIKKSLNEFSLHQDGIQNLTTKENVDGVIEDIMSSLIKGKKLLNYDVLENIANEIADSSSIYVYGQGGTYFVAKDFALRLQRIKMVVHYHNDFAFQKVQALNANINEIYILFSFSGENQNLIEIAKILKSRNSKIITMTKQSRNTLQKISDLNVTIADETTLLRNIVSSSRINMLFIVEILYYLIFKLNEQKNLNLLYQSMKGY